MVCYSYIIIIIIIIIIINTEAQGRKSFSGSGGGVQLFSFSSVHPPLPSPNTPLAKIWRCQDTLEIYASAEATP